jgi:hypothetical protein
MKVYITKYVFTDGITIGESDDSRPISGRGLYIRRRGAPQFCIWLSPSEYSLTREGAILQADQKRDARLRSLAQQAPKLQAIDFNQQVIKAEQEQAAAETA